MKLDKTIYAVDVGSDKIVCLIGLIKADKTVSIKGFAHKNSKGIRYGEIINSEQLSNEIESTIEIAEQMAGKDYIEDDITLNINPLKLEFNIIKGVVKLNKEEVKIKDKEDIVAMIKKELDKIGKDAIHLLLTKYLLDSTKVDDPFNRSCNTFSIDLNLLYADKLYIKNYNNCISNTLKNPFYISNGIANSYALLDMYDKERGTLIVDIGADSTDICLFYNKEYKFEYSIKLAGNVITDDLASVLKISTDVAEKIKKINTNFSLSLLKETDIINMGDIDIDENWEVSKTTIEKVNNIVKDRIKEIGEIIKDILKKNNYLDYVKSIVLSGGTSQIKGIEKIFLEVFNGVDIRVGSNEIGWTITNSEYKETLEKPLYSVSIGILNYLATKDRIFSNDSSLVNFFKKIFN